MKHVSALHKITQNLLEVSKKNNNQEDAVEDREKLIDNINELLEQREHIIKELKARDEVYTEEEKKLGAEIVEWNLEIDALMNEKKQDVELNIKDLKQKKTMNKRYSHPYQGLTGDGTFFDKRK